MDLTERQRRRLTGSIPAATDSGVPFADSAQQFPEGDKIIAVPNPTVFISYSHQDEEWKDRLVTYLRATSEARSFDIWHDRVMGGGERWRNAITEAIRRSCVAVLLVTEHFLGSEFILASEVPELIRYAVRLYPIIIKPCPWQGHRWLEELNLRPADARPLSTGDDNRIASTLTTIANEIASLLKDAGATDRPGTVRYALNVSGVTADGQRIRDLRCSEGLVSPSDLAVKARVGVGQVQLAESGALISIDAMDRIGGALGIDPRLVSRASEPVAYFLTGSEEEQELLLDSLQLYERMFPDKAERDRSDDMETWLQESRNAQASGDPWREIYSVLRLNERVAGMAFISIHLDRQWCFGNYLALDHIARQQSAAERFIEVLRTHLCSSVTDLRGVLFEVERVDEGVLRRGAALGKLPATDETFVASLRALRRILLYQSLGAKMFLRANNVPLPYVQPAMEEPLKQENERPLWLMVYLFPGLLRGEINIDELASFVYSDLFGDAYGGAGDVQIDGYREYVLEVQRRFLIEAASGWKVDRLRFPEEIRHLISRAKREGLGELISL